MYANPTRIDDAVCLREYRDPYEVYVNVFRKLSAEYPSLIFREEWCERNRYIRFSTSALCSLFPEKEGFAGGWGFPSYALYEISVGRLEVLQIDLVFAMRGMEKIFEDFPGIQDNFLKIFKQSKPKEWMHQKIAAKSIPAAKYTENNIEETVLSCLDEVFSFGKR